MNPEPASTLHTRPTLLFRLRDWKDAASWQEFHRLYRQFVVSLAQRSGLTRAEADDVAQDVFKRVAETIHEFEANPRRGSFRRWLMTLTRWRIADKFRERPAGVEHPLRRAESDSTATAERVPDGADADAGWDEEWRKHVLDAALDRLARRLNPRHFQIFDLYARQNWPVRQIADELGIGAASVYLTAHRVKQQLKAEVARLESQLG